MQLCEISQEEIIKCFVYLFVNEGVKILEEGIVQWVSDIDVIYIYGYGFFVYCGGLMQYVSEQGLKNVVVDFEKYGQMFVLVLKQFVDEGKIFSDYDCEYVGV